MLGFDAIGGYALGGSPYVAPPTSVAASISAAATLTGAPTPSELLSSENKRRLIYAAEISPWTLTQ